MNGRHGENLTLASECECLIEFLRDGGWGVCGGEDTEPRLDCVAFETGFVDGGDGGQRDAITPAQCAALAELVYESVGARPDDPETWYSWANRQGVMVQIFQHPAMDAARRSTRKHKAFAQLLGDG